MKTTSRTCVPCTTDGQTPASSMIIKMQQNTPERLQTFLQNPKAEWENRSIMLDKEKVNGSELSAKFRSATKRTRDIKPGYKNVDIENVETLTTMDDKKPNTLVGLNITFKIENLIVPEQLLIEIPPFFDEITNDMAREQALYSYGIPEDTKNENNDFMQFFEETKRRSILAAYLSDAGADEPIDDEYKSVWDYDGVLSLYAMSALIIGQICQFCVERYAYVIDPLTVTKLIEQISCILTDYIEPEKKKQTQKTIEQFQTWRKHKAGKNTDNVISMTSRKK